MATFEDVVTKAKSVAETAGKKTSDFIEVARLKVDAAEMEKDIASTLEGLGRLVYESRKSDKDITTLVDDCVMKLDERYAQLRELRLKIDEYRNKVRCASCGAMNPEDAVFCKKCGAKIEKA